VWLRVRSGQMADRLDRGIPDRLVQPRRIEVGMPGRTRSAAEERTRFVLVRTRSIPDDGAVPDSRRASYTELPQPVIAGLARYPGVAVAASELDLREIRADGACDTAVRT
jgi:hypothetical protein